MTVQREWCKESDHGTLVDASDHAGRVVWRWVDIEQPDEASLQRLGMRFGIDEHALEDALDRRLFPSYEDYGDFVAISMRGLSVEGATVRSTPLLSFVGRDFLVTVHHEPLPGLDFVVETAMSHARTVEGGPDRMFGRLADVGTRRFEPVVEEIDTVLADCESLALVGQQGVMVPLQTVRRQTAQLRTIIRPQRSVIQSLVYADTDLIGERARRRLTDVLERHARLDEALESSRSLANGIIDLHRGAVAEQTNEIMKVLTLFSATLLPMTLIAGIYGMNFSNIPELDFRYGYPIAITVMLSVGLVLWRYFARLGFVGKPKIGAAAGHAAVRFTEAATLPVRTIGSLIADSLRAVVHDEGDADDPGDQ